MAALYALGPHLRLLDGSSQMEAKITFSPFTYVFRKMMSIDLTLRAQHYLHSVHDDKFPLGPSA